MTVKQRKKLIRIITASALLAICFAISSIFKPPRAAALIMYFVPYIVAGFDTLKKSWKGIIRGQVFDENFLMAIASAGAFVPGEYLEGAAVMLFYQIGELFESIAVGKSRRNITALMDIRADYANIERNGEIVKVDPDEVETGSEIIVRAGEKIPIDGIVIEGTSSLDTAALTGESIPLDVSDGSAVQSGSINMSGLIKIRTTKEFGESTASKILELTENSGARKSRSENFISKFARYYTPAVCAGAAALAVIVPLARIAAGFAPMWMSWIMRALTFLVISCPCALVISIPLGFFAGIGCASSHGILIKGSNYLEALSKTRCVVFDKTGTLTKGVFEVAGIHHNSIDESRLLEYAALAESCSNHPIAKSILSAYSKTPDRMRVTDAREMSGLGVTATVDGIRIAAGNERLMETLGIEYTPCRGAGTVVHIAIDGGYAGHILISDIVKPGSERAVRSLARCGVRKTVMLTGDSERSAKPVTEALGVHELYASLLPADKVEIVERLLSEKRKGETLAFAGDGLNDAPVLSIADIGIAMGAIGQDAAIEAADVVLMDDEISKIPLAIRISKKCMRIVYQNIVFSIGVKAICLALGAAGIANMWIAIFADVGVMIIAVLNAVRALKLR